MPFLTVLSVHSINPSTEMVERFLTSLNFQMLKVVWNVIKKVFGLVMLLCSPVKRLWCRRKRRTSDPILPISNHYPSVENLNAPYAPMNGTGQVR